MGSFTEEDFLSEAWDTNQAARLLNLEMAYVNRLSQGGRSSLETVRRKSYRNPRLLSRTSVMKTFTIGLRNYTDNPEVLARQILLGERQWIGVDEALPLFGYTTMYLRKPLDSGVLPITFFRMDKIGHISMVRESAVEWFTERLTALPAYAKVDAAELAGQLLSGEDAWLLPSEVARLINRHPKTAKRLIRRATLLPASAHYRFLKSDVLKRRSAT